MKKTTYSFAFLALLMGFGGSSHSQDVPANPTVDAVGQTSTDMAKMPAAVVTPPAPQPTVDGGVPAVANDASVAFNPDNILNPQGSVEKEISDQLLYLNPSINVNLIPSLFFSVWEHDLIVDARRGLKSGFSTTAISEGEASPITDIALGGIVYKGSNKWTVWLNNTRITPDAIPTEILDIKVFKEYIELEWFDKSKNLIFPIKLRPHQRFNLETRMFLPG